MKIILLIITFFLSCVVDGFGQVLNTPTNVVASVNGVNKYTLNFNFDAANIFVAPLTGSEKLWFEITIDNGSSTSIYKTPVQTFEISQSYSFTSTTFLSPLTQYQFKVKAFYQASTISPILTSNISSGSNFVATNPLTPAGVTVITHGFDASNGIPSAGFNAWLKHGFEIAEHYNLTHPDSPKATVFTNNNETGLWEISSFLPNGTGNINGELIFVYNWTIYSNNNSYNRWLEAAADHLFASLIQPSNTNGTAIYDITPGKMLLDKKTHFIGHSRGGVLMLQLAHRLANFFPAIKIEQLTLLDPHPAARMGDVLNTIDINSSLPCVFGYADDCTKYICYSGVHSIVHPDYVNLKIPENVINADNYYRTEATIYEPTADVLTLGQVFPFSGVPVVGLGHNRKLNNTTITYGMGALAPGGAHSGVHNWYFSTLEPFRSLSDEKANWFMDQADDSDFLENSLINENRTSTGFNHSRLGGGVLPSENNASSKILLPTMNQQLAERLGLGTNYTINKYPEPLINGDFSGPYGANKGGWFNGKGNYSYAGTNEIKVSIIDGNLPALPLLLQTAITHNHFYCTGNYLKVTCKLSSSNILTIKLRLTLYNNFGTAIKIVDQKVEDANFQDILFDIHEIKEKVGSFSLERIALATDLDYIIFKNITIVELPVYEKGITVITHGFSRSGDINSDWKDNARILRRRVSSELGQNKGATILINDPTTGKWKFLDGENGNLSNTEEIIFLYDWAISSNNLETGYLEASADHLFSLLASPVIDSPNGLVTLNAQPGELLLNKHTHFIGHSRGGILMLQLLHRIKKNFPVADIERLTLLDPHPAGRMDDVNRKNISSSYPNLPGVYGYAYDCGILFCDESNTGIKLKVPDNVKKAENFYRWANKYEPIVTNYAISPFSGVEVQGIGLESNFMDNTVMSEGFYQSPHTAVADWYFATVDVNSSVPSRWFSTDNGPFMANKNRLNVGYNRVLNDVVTTIDIAELESKLNERTGNVTGLTKVVGGDFAYNSPAGWELNNFGHSVPHIFNKELILSPTHKVLQPIGLLSKEKFATHNIMFFPANSKALSFDAKFDKGTYSGTAFPLLKIDFLDVSGNLISFTARSIQKNTYTKYNVTLPEMLIGKLGSFKITFIENGTNNLAQFDDGNANVKIDNIDLTETPSTATAPVITATATNLIPGEVAWLTAIGCETGTIQWSNNATGSTLIITANQPGTYAAVCEINGFLSPSSNEITITSTGVGNLGNVETFFDLDPGYGNGNHVNISGSKFEGTIPLTINNLPEGIHTFNIRIKDSNNRWSLTHTKPFLILGKASITGQKGIETVEYFIDFLKDDYSNLVSINVTPDGDNIAIDLPINLPMGIHSISFRVKDSEGKISIFHTKTFLVIGQGNSGQNSISKVQYFFDNDPGESTRLMQNISLDANNQTIIPINISLPEGIHAVSFRVQDTQNRWSIFHTKTFLVIGQGNGTGKIAKVEYFIDNDLGFDKGTQIPYTATPMSFNIDLSNYTQGVHVVYVRVKMDNGAWSLTHAKTFMIIPNTGQNTIDKIEYFLDNTDPGEGNAINVSFIPNSEGGVTANFDLATTQLTTGVHKISVRARGQNGIWSPIRNSSFELTQPSCTAMTTIKSGNWNDPSVWSCNRVPISTDNITISTGHTISVPTGNYQVNSISTLAGSNLSYQTGAVILIFGN